MNLGTIAKTVLNTKQRLICVNGGIIKSRNLSLASQRVLFAAQPPYNDQDIERFGKVLRTIPSFAEKDQSIDAKDIAPFLKAINYIRTKEQTDAYEEYTNKILGGRFSIEFMKKIMRQCHDNPEATRVLVEMCDKNGNGFIEADEYKQVLKTMLPHDPTIPQLAFEDFVREADTNKDKKVSIDEAVAWLKKYLK